MVHSYRVYGLEIAADAPIDGLIPRHGFVTPDVRMHVAAMPPLPQFHSRRDLADADDPVTLSDGTNGQILFEYRDGTKFLLNAAGSEIWAAWSASSTPADMATYLVGPILAFVLRMRGQLSFHGSSVVVDGRAVGLVGASGQGKSTTASAFVEAGCDALTDDVLAVAWKEDLPVVLPGPARLRLWPETVLARYGSPEALPQLTPTWTKRYLDTWARGKFSLSERPLDAIVLLGTRSAGGPSIKRLSGHEAVAELVANTSMNLYIDQQMRRNEFLQIVRLANSVPIFRAHASDDLKRIDEFCDAIFGTLLEVSS